MVSYLVPSFKVNSLCFVYICLVMDCDSIVCNMSDTGIAAAVFASSDSMTVLSWALPSRPELAAWRKTPRGSATRDACRWCCVLAAVVVAWLAFRRTVALCRHRMSSQSGVHHAAANENHRLKSMLAAHCKAYSPLRVKLNTVSHSKAIMPHDFFFHSVE